MTYVRIPLDLWESLLAAVEIVPVVPDAPAVEIVPVPPAPPAPPLSDNAEVENAFVDYAKFYQFLKRNKLLGPTISRDEFAGCNTIIRHCVRARWPVSWVAYALATAYHETAHTMMPVKEIGGTAYFTRMYDIRGNRPDKARELGNLTPGDGARYAGRGYPQTTGRNNYAKATTKLRAMGYDVDLVANPDRMMEPEIAAATMISGMEEGWFTGRKITDDLPDENTPATLAQFASSRDVINGKDKAAQIAAYAMDFQTGLVYAGYRLAA